jgi:hypothetical protein
MQIEANNAASLRLAFGEYGRGVPERSLRCSQDREAWCLRRYLLTLADSGRLSFPLRVTKFETPDYKVEGVTNFGVEVTEATTQRDQKEMSKSEKLGRVSGFGEFGGRGRDGWLGNDAERTLIDDIAASLEKKSSKSWKCQPVRLLIYPNSNASVVACWDEAVKMLQGDVERSRFENFSDKLSEVSVIAGNQLWFDILGEFSRLSLVES